MAESGTAPNAWLHLMIAVEESSGHLGAGIRLIVDPAWQPMSGQPAFQDLATGVEKLCKITLGLWVEAESGHYPADKEAAKARHGIAALVAKVRDGIVRRAEASRNAYVLELCLAIESEPSWRGLVSLMETAADATTGRYRQTTILGGGDLTNHPSAYDAWQLIEYQAIEKLGLWREVSRETNTEAQLSVRQESLRPVLMWWHLIFRAWQHGLVGPLAQSAAPHVSRGFEVLPPDLRQISKTL